MSGQKRLPMETALYILHVLVCLAMLPIILLQSGKGGGVSAVFGGGGGGSVMGSRGASNFLTRMTTGAAIIFMCTSLALSYLSSRASSVVGQGPERPAETGEPSPGAPIQASPPGEGAQNGADPDISMPLDDLSETPAEGEEPPTERTPDESEEAPESSTPLDDGTGAQPEDPSENETPSSSDPASVEVDAPPAAEESAPVTEASAPVTEASAPVTEASDGPSPGSDETASDEEAQ